LKTEAEKLIQARAKLSNDSFKDSATNDSFAVICQKARNLQRYAQNVKTFAKKMQPLYKWSSAMKSLRHQHNGECSDCEISQSDVNNLETLKNSERFEKFVSNEFHLSADTTDIKDIMLQLFVNKWGKHAEDAFIHQFLQQLDKRNSISEKIEIPKKIEIYGTEDPCFQCQMKLQWLANSYVKLIHIHNKKLSSATPPQHVEISTPPQHLEICYYAKNRFNGMCVCSNPNKKFEGTVSSSDNPYERTSKTRPRSLKGKLLKFTFVGNGEYDSPFEFKWLKKNTLLLGKTAVKST